MVDKTLTTGKRMLVIGEWINSCSYVVFDGSDLKLLKITQ